MEEKGDDDQETDELVGGGEALGLVEDEKLVLAHVCNACTAMTYLVILRRKIDSKAKPSQDHQQSHNLHGTMP